MDLLKSYLDIYLKYNPTFGSQHGFCEYDNKLENPTAVNLMQEVDDYIEWIETHSSHKTENKYQIIKSKIKKRIYEVVLWEKPFTDPNYYFTIVYNSIFWIAERLKEKDITDNIGVRTRISLVPDLMETMMDNLKKVPRKYITIWKKNIKSINDFHLDSTIKSTLIKVMEKYTKQLEALPDTEYFLGYDKIQRIFSNNEMMPIDLHKIYKTAIKEHRKYKAKFLKELNKIDGKTQTEKVTNYETKYFLTKIKYTTFINQIFEEFDTFLNKTRLIDTSYLESTLNVIPSYLLNMSINEIHFCKSHNKKFTSQDTGHINLYVYPQEVPYNYVSIINTLVHEYIHYIQYESDRVKNNQYSAFLYNISTGEGVAHFFEEYIYKKGFRNFEYKLSYLHNIIYWTAKFLIGYEIHVKHLPYDAAVKRFKELSVYNDDEAATRLVDELISDTYNMDYYLGKTLIKNHMRKNKNFNVNNLIKNGSIPLKFIFT